MLDLPYFGGAATVKKPVADGLGRIYEKGPLKHVKSTVDPQGALRYPRPLEWPL